MREIDPIHDLEWLGLIDRHPQASVFHTPGWLEALKRTYGYEPVVLTVSSSSHEVTNGLVLCRVSSWVTGRRIVSLPFSDHCEPLVNNREELRSILEALREERNGNGWKYIEIRPAEGDLAAVPGFTRFKNFCLHRLDLRPALPDIFQRFHKDCVQRKIWRAEREGLGYEEGRSEMLLEKFYRLLVLTRRRQFLLPQPLSWFRNLITCMGDKLKIHVVSKDGQPVASVLTLSYKSAVVYKYGCSDKRLSNLGGTHLIFWKVIQDAKDRGFEEFDMGRSDWDQAGLVRFKDRWGAARSTLTYWRHGAVPANHVNSFSKSLFARQIFDHAPSGFLSTTGTILYRHVG